MSANPLSIGDRLHGFQSGYFGRDSYVCRRVEAIGPDWAVTRQIEPYSGRLTGDGVELVSGQALFHVEPNTPCEDCEDGL